MFDRSSIEKEDSIGCSIPPAPLEASSLRNFDTLAKMATQSVFPRMCSSKGENPTFLSEASECPLTRPVP